MCTSTVLRRAFDKAVRRKPPVVAADAGPTAPALPFDTVYAGKDENLCGVDAEPRRATPRNGQRGFRGARRRNESVSGWLWAG